MRSACETTCTFPLNLSRQTGHSQTWHSTVRLASDKSAKPTVITGLPLRLGSMAESDGTAGELSPSIIFPHLRETKHTTPSVINGRPVSFSSGSERLNAHCLYANNEVFINVLHCMLDLKSTAYFCRCHALIPRQSLFPPPTLPAILPWGAARCGAENGLQPAPGAVM